LFSVPATPQNTGVLSLASCRLAGRRNVVFCRFLALFGRARLPISLFIKALGKAIVRGGTDGQKRHAPGPVVVIRVPGGTPYRAAQDDAEPFVEFVFFDTTGMNPTRKRRQRSSRMTSESPSKFARKRPRPLYMAHRWHLGGIDCSLCACAIYAMCVQPLAQGAGPSP
jgi:hypothetical protein